jgi:caffeoyl-CoA O-methyltransferase
MADQSSRTGARYADPAILEYAERVHAAHDSGLRRAFDAPASANMPAIQVSSSEGKLLGLFLRMIGARRVVEVGTLAGYSAIRMARAMPDDGKLYTLELDPHHAEVARGNIAAAGLADRVEVRVGRALELLPQLSLLGPFDAVFLDADKEGYADYARWATANLRRGGLLLADNSYFFGHLLEETPAAAAVRRFHESVPADFDSTCVPTPDGLVVGIRR